ncbi:nucleoside recognition domain protein [Caldicellulosiruptor obsidiansis OB47]|uniref:Nucleoside recognition domain protein n=1 Tax=Caldicellulosiruptor obsidiansis (strain ATCC BAA-2073 / JCM 16842 / OB47) TaxID=608506 RepID=D9TH46_CALOO|nr:nucleoside recognition domain-containing protein [Caldicellulosiruptor obsidiansis]ADL43443.1 nucleoside recognition domain protein [Caldicellulosiruptor obsidiansis OB47]
MNIFWIITIISAILYQLFFGNVEKLTEILFSAPQKAADIFFTILLSIMLWSGFLRVVQDSNFIEIFKKVLRPVLEALFRTKNEKALNFMLLNVVANILGLGNAATPAGILAMQELSKEAKNSTASDDMILFVLINTCSIQLIPTTAILLRTKFSSSAPAAITFPTLFVSMASLFVGIILCKVLAKVWK